MGDKRKMLQESHVEANLDPSEIEDSDALERKKELKELKKQRKELKRRKKERKERKEQKKKIDELSNSLKETIETVKKLEKKTDLEEISLKEKETPKKECCFESEDADMKNPQTIFVLGFDCSFPRDDIRRSLKEHFSSCGEVSKLFLPFHCKTGSPMGFAFINMKSDDRKALTLNHSIMGGQRILVTMAIDRSEYSGYSNHKGCKRCGTVLLQRRWIHFHEAPIRGRRPRADDSSEEDEEAN